MLGFVGRNLKKSRGQALVEFALVVPVLIIILLGLVEFGRFSSAYLTLQHGSREGARVAVVGATDGEVVTRIQQISAGLDAGSLQILIDPVGVQRKMGDPITVSLNYQFRFMAPFVSQLMGEHYTIGVSTTMRVE